MNEGALVSKGVRQRKHVILKLTKKLEVFIDASDSLGCQKSVVLCYFLDNLSFNSSHHRTDVN